MKLTHNVSCCIRLMTMCIVLLLLSTTAHAGIANTLTVTKAGDGTGTVRSQAAGIDCGDSCSSVFDSVETAYLTAIPDSGSYFNGWSGGCTGQALTCAVTMVADLTVTATFSTTPPTVMNWVKRFDVNLDAGNAVLQTRDGGYVVAGQLNGQTVYPGLFSVMKLDASGTIVWNKYYEGTASAAAYAIREDADGNYIVGGKTLSYNNAYTAEILRIAADGTLLSAKSLVTRRSYLEGAIGYNAVVNGLDLDQTGVILAGSVQYPEAGNYNPHLWIGEMTFYPEPYRESLRWQIAMGGNGTDAANAVRMTSDGGYIVAGETTSFGAGGNDAWLIKLKSGGAITWQKTYGGSGNDAAKDIQQTGDGGFVVAGSTRSPVYGAWVAKLDNAGNIVWQNVYGGGEARSIKQTIDGGYIVAGIVLTATTGYDAWLMKLNPDGSVAWRRTYGSTGDDDARSVQQAADGGYILTGRYASGDTLVLKTDENGNVFGCGLGFSTSSPVTPVTATTAAASLANSAVTINIEPGLELNYPYPYSIGDMYPVEADIALTGSGALCSGAGPALSVTPMTLSTASQWYNIGATRAYTHKTQIVTIANNGNRSLTISSFARTTISSYLTLSPTGGSKPCNSFSNKSIAAGDYCTATIDYYPAALGNHYADFRLVTNDPNRPDITMRYTATCAIPVLQPSTTMVSFGLYKVQQPSSSQTLTLKNGNAATGDLQIGTVAITGDNADEFALTANNCPAQLSPQATCAMEFTFTPKGIGMRTATIAISSNDAISPTTIAINGVGGYLLTVINLDASGGKVTDTVGEGDPNINCGTTCTYLVGDAQTIELTATPVSGFQFSGWSGEGCSGIGACSVTMDQNRTVTAGFSGGDLLYVTFNPLASGSGIVTMTSPINTSFNKDFQTHLPNQSTVTLTGQADPFSIFTGWSGGVCSGNADCQFTINGSTTVTATFDFDAAHMIYNPDRDIYYSSLQTAYNEALDGNQILVWGVEHAENLTCGQPNGQQKNVFIRGGYDEGYGQNSDVTYLKGQLIITQGKVVAEKLIIR